MRESGGGKPTGAMKVNDVRPQGWIAYAIQCPSWVLAQHSPVPIACDGAAEERMG
jgi:hypothetical protein